jgi:hypothetical protein
MQNTQRAHNMLDFEVTMATKAKHTNQPNSSHNQLQIYIKYYAIKAFCFLLLVIKKKTFINVNMLKNEKNV